MPDFNLADSPIDIARNAILLDTSVLVASFLKSEPQERREYARYLLNDEDRWTIFIPIATVVESWGFIVGSRKMFDDGLELLTWINSPGRAAIIPHHKRDNRSTVDWISKSRVDCVDVMIAELATDITRSCGFSPSVHIATFDTSDFTRLMGEPELKYSLLDMNSYEVVEL